MSHLLVGGVVTWHGNGCGWGGLPGWYPPAGVSWCPSPSSWVIGTTAPLTSHFDGEEVGRVGFVDAHRTTEYYPKNIEIKLVT
jgi:hypothetical protein